MFKNVFMMSWWKIKYFAAIFFAIKFYLNIITFISIKYNTERKKHYNKVKIMYYKTKYILFVNEFWNS